MIIIPPKEVLALQKPWHLPYPQYIQKLIRFNGSVVPIGTNNGLHIVEHLSGGAGTFRARPLPTREIQMVQQAIQEQYFEKKYNGTQQEAATFFAQKNVSLRLDNNHKISDELLQLTMDIYSILPEQHIGHKHFNTLRLGGWGSGAAKCSEYSNPTVHMFTFATEGAKRNYAALLLHETGHSHNNLLKEKGTFDELHEYRHRSITPFGIDFLFGAQDRFEHVKMSTEEFGAEWYALYVSQGGKLRDFIHTLEPTERPIWIKTYKLFKESFEGIEYI